MLKSRLLAAVLSVSFVGVAGIGCGDDNDDKDRWATTENTNVKIDWDKINEAYKTANGPDDLEKKINEIYEGDEIISVSVKDESKEVQVVTGFFDKDKNGQVDEGEKIFTIKRDLHAGGKAQYQTSGHGHYGGYHSPMYPLMAGMMTGMMISAMWHPGYSPMYSRGYVTSHSRASSLSSNRSSYRAANPSRFSRGGTSGRSYGSPSTRSRSTSSSGGGGGGRSSGGSFGVRLRGPATRLTA